MEKDTIAIQGRGLGISFELKLESMVATVPNSSLMESTPEMLGLQLVDEVAEEIKRALVKSQKITQLDGHPASVLGLTMTGKTSVEKIYVTYRTGENTSASRWYSRKDFYDL